MEKMINAGKFLVWWRIICVRNMTKQQQQKENYIFHLCLQK